MTALLLAFLADCSSAVSIDYVCLNFNAFVEEGFDITL
jgi:hypothetical protein